jgi:hypothetical protein
MISTLLLVAALQGSQVTEPNTKVTFHTELQPAAGADALAQFRGFFTDELASGTELLFSWAHGTLSVSIGGEPAGEIENAALCWTLFDVYLGEKPITSDGKKTVVARLPEILGG